MWSSSFSVQKVFLAKKTKTTPIKARTALGHVYITMEQLNSYKRIQQIDYLVLSGKFLLTLVLEQVFSSLSSK